MMVKERKRLFGGFCAIAGFSLFAVVVLLVPTVRMTAQMLRFPAEYDANLQAYRLCSDDDSCHAQIVADEVRTFPLAGDHPLIAFVKFNGLWRMMRLTGESLGTELFQDVKDVWRGEPFGRIRVTMNNKKGFVDTNGRIVVTPQWDNVGGFQTPGVAWVAQQTSEKLDRFDNGLRWGLIDTAGRQLIPCRFQRVDDFTYELGDSARRRIAWVQQGGLWGTIDLEGRTVIQPTYMNIYTGNPFIIAQKEKKWGIFRDSMRLIVPFMYDNIMMMGDTSFRSIVFQYDKADMNMGKIDSAGRIVVPILYNNSFSGAKRGHFITRRDKLWGVIDEYLPVERQVIIPCMYDTLCLNKPHVQTNVGESLYLAKRSIQGGIERKWGLLGADGRTLVSFMYDTLLLHNERCIVRLGNRYGIISTNGTTLAPCEYADIGFAYDYRTQRDVFWASNTTETKAYALLDTNGRRITPFLYDKIKPATDYECAPDYSAFLAKRGGLSGVLDALGREILPIQYTNVTFQAGMIAAMRDDAGTAMWRLFDFKGNALTIQTFDSIREFTNRLLFVKYRGTWGVVAPAAELNSPLNNRLTSPTAWFDEVRVLSKPHVFLTRTGTAWEFILTATQRSVSGLRYSTVLTPFDNKFAVVKRDGRWGFVNLETGAETVQCIYEAVYPFKNGYARVRRRALYGLIDTSGKEVLPFRYDALLDVDERGVARAWREGKDVVIRKHGGTFQE
jgi:hypothetical protein